MPTNSFLIAQTLFQAGILRIRLGIRSQSRDIQDGQRAPRRLDKIMLGEGIVPIGNKIANHLIAQYFLFSQFLHIIEMTQRKATSLEPIPPSSGNESTKKAMKTYFCVGCGNVATQTAFFKVEGATVIERYCDNCVKTVT